MPARKDLASTPNRCVLEENPRLPSSPLARIRCATQDGTAPRTASETTACGDRRSVTRDSTKRLRDSKIPAIGATHVKARLSSRETVQPLPKSGVIPCVSAAKRIT